MNAVQLLKQKFTEHPRAAGETYCGHLSFALRSSFRLASCAVAAAMHAVFPFTFETYVSDHVPRIAGEMAQRRRRVDRRIQQQVQRITVVD